MTFIQIAFGIDAVVADGREHLVPEQVGLRRNPVQRRLQLDQAAKERANHASMR